MSDILSVSSNLYEEDLNCETTLDLASKNLEIVPEINNKFLCALYLQNNKIETLPDAFFPSLPCLMWLDVRDNRLLDIPSTILEHPSLTHLLLQNNKLTSLPNELGTVMKLKVVQLSGNPLMYPAREIIHGGIKQLLAFLRDKYLDNLFLSDNGSTCGNISNNIDGYSYNSVTNEEIRSNNNKTLTIKFSEKEFDESEDEDCYSKRKGKCPRLAKSRFKSCPSFFQSAKYLKPLRVGDKATQIEKIKESYLKEVALKKHKDLLLTQEKVLQDRKNMELLQNWRKVYKTNQLFLKSSGDRRDPTFPYDTNPEYMTLMSREDIEKDLPDKYRKKLIRKSKQTVPRKNTGDVHLAMRIKHLFENLEAINVDRKDMTPRTEQKVLMGEIQKISEIKQKLMELSVSNTRSVVLD